MKSAKSPPDGSRDDLAVFKLILWFLFPKFDRQSGLLADAKRLFGINPGSELFVFRFRRRLPSLEKQDLPGSRKGPCLFCVIHSALDGPNWIYD